MDAEDWALVLAGDGEAFGRVFDRHAVAVRRQARRILTTPADIEDAVAIVFFEAWRRRASVPLVDGSMLPWLLVTATNAARNVRRSRNRWEGLLARLPAQGDAPDPASVLEDRDVLDALRTLTLRDQQVLTLCVLEGWSEQDAARVLEVPLGTVKSRLFRAKQRLQQRIGRPGGAVNGTELTHGTR